MAIHPRLGRHAVLGAIAFALAVLVRAWAVPAYNVVVITLDTTRADRLSPYGFMNVTLPHLERLAREGVVFDQATTVAPLTLPAHTSLFTGLLPPRHGVRDNADPPLAEAATTLEEMLHARGFRTGAFVGSIVLDPDRGLKQGFEHYSGVEKTDRIGPEGRQRRADDVVGDALDWLDGVGASPFFLWAHLYDAHRPYDPPEPFSSTYAHNPYVGEIAYADSQIGVLLAGLERRRLLDRTIIVIAGDHGESLEERGERDHGIFIYENVLRVPLIIRAPGIAPRRVDDVVRLTDIMPTILDLLNVRPAGGIDGVSLTELMYGLARDLDLEAYAESVYPERLGMSGLRSLRVGRYKLIDAPRPELFDLQRDPFEETNIYEDRRDLGATMQARAASLAAAGDASAARHDRATSPNDVRERLAALGYAVADRPRRPTGQDRLPDPKDRVLLLNPDNRVNGSTSQLVSRGKGK
jgi:arylsulfatase A-like enzyme